MDGLAEFLKRLQDQLKGFSPIVAYNQDRVAVFVNEKLSRYRVAALMLETSSLIVIHDGVERNAHEEHETLGRDCDAYEATITTIVRTAKTVSVSSLQDPAVLGDSDRPGVAQMQTDVFELLWNSGVMNRLPDATGVNLLWDLEIGAAGPINVLEEEQSSFVESSRRVIGHRYREHW